MALDAQHPGICPACGSRYSEGARIRWRTNVGYNAEPEVETPGWGHEHCPDPLAVTSPPCPACFLVHPVGACDR